MSNKNRISNTNIKQIAKLVKYFTDLYQNLGFSIIPIPYKQKGPVIKWAEYQKRPATEEEIKKWFDSNNQINIGVVCGKISKLVVLDFDNLEVYRAFVKTYGELFPEAANFEEATWVVESSETHRHMYLRTEENIQSAKYLDLGFEIHSDGTIVVAPPSTHPEGHRYKFINSEIKEPLKVSNLGVIIDNFLAKYGKKISVLATKTVANQPKNTQSATGNVAIKLIVLDKLRVCFKKWYLGGRKLTGIQRLGALNELLANNATDEELHEYFKKTIETYDYRKTQKKIDYVRKKGYKPYTCEKIRQVASRELDELCNTCPIWKSKVPEERICVSDLQAGLVGRNVQVNVQIVGEQSQKALPRFVKVNCSNCGSNEEIDVLESKQFLLDVIFKEWKSAKEYAFAIFKSKYGAECGERAQHDLTYKELDYMDYAVLYIRDLLENVEKFDRRVYTSRRTHLVNQALPNAKKVSIHGSVVVEPKTRNIIILADKIEPLENMIDSFVITKEDKENWTKYFNHGIEAVYQIAPDMVGQDVVRLAHSLILHSPPQIPDINGKNIRGVLRIILYGDTHTYKSESTKDFTLYNYKLGDYIVGESSTRAGITYTIDTDKKSLIWGALPLNDLGLVVIDGLHTVYSEEMRELREALELMRVIVRRSQSGEAFARTRVIGIFNPKRPMDSYYLKCSALIDGYIFQETPDITRWDLFIPFSDSDVNKEEIAKATRRPRPIPDNVYVRHIYWTWSRKPEDIIYAENAKQRIVEDSARLMKRYSTALLPIVHNGFREILSRLSVAWAAWRHSTDETHQKIIVNELHVTQVVKWLEDVLDDLGLYEYKEEEEGRRSISKNEFEIIVKELGETEWAILDEIKVKPISSTILAEKLEKSDETVKRHYKLLRKHGLIVTSPHIGIVLSPRGVAFLRHVRQNNGLIGTKNVPNVPNFCPNDNLEWGWNHIRNNRKEPVEFFLQEFWKYTGKKIKRSEVEEVHELLLDAVKLLEFAREHRKFREEETYRVLKFAPDRNKKLLSFLISQGLLTTDKDPEPYTGVRYVCTGGA